HLFFLAVSSIVSCLLSSFFCPFLLRVFAPVTSPFSLLRPPPPRSTLFPYTTLFRSRADRVLPNSSPIPPPNSSDRLFQVQYDRTHFRQIVYCKILSLTGKQEIHGGQALPHLIDLLLHLFLINV